MLEENKWPDELDRKIKIGKNEVLLDEEKLRFNEATLTKFFEEEALNYDYYGRMLADAEYLLQRNELNYDVTFAEKFKSIKDGGGGSDALCNSKALVEEDVIEAKKAVLLSKRKVKLLQQHLRAWDKAHENALNLGYTLRREMSKLHSSISFEDEVNKIVGN